MYESFLGTVVPWAGIFAPQGWMWCHGQQLYIQQYPALNAVLGGTYGGDGKTYFNLPNLLGRFPMGAGTAPNRPAIQLGGKGGSSSYTITLAQLPSHTHATAQNLQVTLAVAAAPGSSTGPIPGANAISVGGVIVDEELQPQSIYKNGGGSVVGLGGLSVTAPSNVTVAAIGSGLPFATLPPFQVLDYIICTEGWWPSRP